MGKFVTSRNIATVWKGTATTSDPARRGRAIPPKFKVSGRGSCPIVLIETMRREGYELAVSRRKW